MTAVAIPLVYDKREWFAQGGAMLAGIMLAFAITHLAIRHDPLPPETPIEVTLAEPPVEQPKPVEPPKPIEPPKPPQPVHHESKPEPVKQTPVTPVAAKPSPVPESNPVSVPVAPVAAEAKTIPPAPPSPPQSNAAAEGRFAKDVRAQIEHNKVYPDSARDLGMAGAVEILYVLDRTGKLVSAEVTKSSGYPLLDQAALRAVRSASFAAFPADAWVGENQKEFRTKLVFSINY